MIHKKKKNPGNLNITCVHRGHRAHRCIMGMTHDIFIFSRGVTTPSIRIKRFLWKSFDFIEFFSRLSRAKVNFALHSLLENFEVSKFISNFAA